ncbi:MAG TPA: putative DNA-binding domain-containing protein [Polyangiaceae bacterium]|nr:putative DNA-binding domain-containing protein [Polyangiaceae bacterium]
MPGIESLLGELLLGPAPSPDLLAKLCKKHEISATDASALRDSYERLAVYRELVRGNLREALSLSIPRSMARLGPLFDEYFDRFLQERAPRTHYLRDVTPELLEFCAPLWASDARVPRYLYDLALHESLHIEVSALPTLPRGHQAAPLTLEQGVDFGAALRHVSYHHAVHELPEDEQDRSVPSERQVQLLVYRSPEHEVRYLELTPVASGIVERLLAGESLGAAVTRAAAASGTSLTEAVLEGAARLLADLAERGVIRGPRPEGSSSPA